MKKALLILVLILGLGFSRLSVKAYDAAVNKMKIVMTVNENGLITVDNYLDVTFSVLSHGIYVYIPQDYRMTWTIDGKEVKRSYHWPITGLQVYYAEKYQWRVIEGTYYLRLGDPEVQFTGARSYRYSYQIQMKDLGLNGIQLFYMNIIGTGWELPIEQVEYEITLPADWPSEIFLYQGPDGSTQTIQSYSVDHRVLSGTATNLAPHEGLTIYTQLSDKGSFITYIKPTDYTLPIVLSSIGLTVLFYLIFLKYGKDRPLIVTPQFGPPNGLTSSQIGYIVDGTVTLKDMVSVIMEWAYKGYIKIIDNEDPLKMVFEKLNEIPPEENEADKSLFHNIFKDRDSVSIETLQENIYDRIKESAAIIIDHFESVDANRIFDVRSFGVKFVLSIIGCIPYVSLLYHQILLNDRMTSSISGVVLLSLMVMVVLIFYWIKIIESWFSLDSSRKVYRAILGVVAVILFLIHITLSLNQVYSGQGLIVLKMILVFVMTVLCVGFSLLMDRRSQLGTDLLGQIVGLRNFIETAEKDRIIALVKEDPGYFYKILPYAYIFGITDVWTSKFNALTVEKPSWYISDGNFDAGNFAFSMLNHLDAIKIDVPSIKASKEVGGALLNLGSDLVQGGATIAGGLRGGGGRSGGGFGGGGGGRW